MVDKRRVSAYYDGSNFYHYLKSNYGIVNIDFFNLTKELVDFKNEDLIKINYFNSPVNQQENPEAYVKQQKFFVRLRNTPLMEIFLGSLVKRPLSKINVNCVCCGHQRCNCLKCPKCNNEIDVQNCFRYTEKGIDVKLAIQLLLDALNNKYDIALLFSGDADFSPVIKYITEHLNKQVVYCHFPHSKTSELLQVCSRNKLITKEMVENAKINV